MLILKKGTPNVTPKHRQFEITCPDCKSKLRGYEYEFDKSYITDHSFICPVCGVRRHISREEMKEVDNRCRQKSMLWSAS